MGDKHLLAHSPARLHPEARLVSFEVTCADGLLPPEVVEVGECKLQIVVGNQRDQPGQMIGHPEIVMVTKGDPIPFRYRDTSHAGACRADIINPDCLNRRTESTYSFICVIRGSIIYDYNFLRLEF